MAPMYLDSVLFDIRKDSAPPKLLHAEHLFKLNEAVFNLNEDDTVDSEMATKIFQTVEMIRKSYNSGKFDNTDCNFFYDYLALLGTMQNQHFFSQTQTEKMLGWIREVMDDDSLAGSVPKEGAKASKKALKEMEANSHALEAEVATLRKRLAKYEASESSGGKAKSKGKKSPSPERGGKGSSGKKGKSSMYDDYYDYYEDDYYYEAPKGKSKGKGKGKVDSSPPSTKGKGKGGKGYEEKGKGKDTGKGGKSPVKGSGKDGKDGKPGAKGPAGIPGKKGVKGDSCKSELQVHLNALKSYVDMKFDVLKGMVDKTMTRTADSGVVKDLLEDNDASEKMDTLQQQLATSFTQLTEA